MRAPTCTAWGACSTRCWSVSRRWWGSPAGRRAARRASAPGCGGDAAAPGARRPTMRNARRGAAASHRASGDIRAWASGTGGGTVVWGAYYSEGDWVRSHVQVIDATRGTVLRGVEPVGAPRRAPTQAAEALRGRLTALFDTLFPPAHR